MALIGVNGFRARAAIGLVCLLFGVLIAFTVEAQTDALLILDQDGKPLEGAVVTLNDGVSVLTGPPQSYQIAQKKQQFSPKVLVIPVGSQVSFPNQDITFHHVYSFSAPRPFELKLYKGDVHSPLEFLNPGLVELGCNIHDRMRGYVYVTQDPVFGVSDAKGQVRLQPLPPGFQVDGAQATLWHARQLAEVKPVALRQGSNLVIPVKPPPKPVRRGLGSWKARQ